MIYTISKMDNQGFEIGKPLYLKRYTYEIGINHTLKHGIKCRNCRLDIGL